MKEKMTVLPLLNAAKLVLFISFFAHVCSYTDWGNKQFFLQKENPEESRQSTRLLIAAWVSSGDGVIGGCEIFNNPNLIERVLSSVPYEQIQNVSEDEVKEILEDCTKLYVSREPQVNDYVNNSPTSDYRKFSESTTKASSSNRRKNDKEKTWENDVTSNFPATSEESDSTTEPVYHGLPVIWPGTKWCGAGDIAKTFDDLGIHADTDKCCRAHDVCNDTMAPGQTKKNLTNTSTFTKLSCQCDDEFYDCLSNVDSVISNGIGNLYFNVLKRECYREDYPLTKQCKKYRSLLRITCKEYKRDASAPKVNQWVPAKRYKKLPIPGPISITVPF